MWEGQRQGRGTGTKPWEGPGCSDGLWDREGGGSRGCMWKAQEEKLGTCYLGHLLTNCYSWCGAHPPHLALGDPRDPPRPTAEDGRTHTEPGSAAAS